MDRLDLIAVIGVLILGMSAYANTLHAPFVFDDITNIVDNPAIRLTALTTSSLQQAAFESPLPTRPVANLTFAFNYLAGGYEVLGYHVVNLAIHLVNAVLVYALAFLTLDQWRILSRGAGKGTDRAWPRIIALIAAWIFVSHPVQTQAVTYIVQRMSSLGTLFFLTSLLLYILGRRSSSGLSRWAYWAAGAFASLCAFGTKENTASLPVTVLLYEWFFFRDLDSGWLRRRALPLLGILVLAALIAAPWERIMGGYSTREFTLVERLLTELRVLWHYLWLFAAPLPSNLNLIHDLSLSRSLIDPPTTALSLTGLAALLAAAFVTARRYRIPSFCILWYLLNLAVESSIVPIEIMYEHRLYLPMFGLALLAAWLIGGALRWRPAPAVSFTAVVAVSLGFATYLRNAAWSDEVSLWTDVVAKSPGSHRGHYNLANALRESNELDAAIEHYRLSLRADASYHKAHNNLGTALVEVGRIDEAVSHYTQALRIYPEYAQAHNNLGRALVLRGEKDKARYHYREALRMAPDYARAHYNLANLLEREGELERAISHYQSAVRIDSSFALAHNNLGIALARAGRLEEAAASFSAAVAADPRLADARLNFAQAFLLEGDLRAACEQVKEALKLGAVRARIALVLRSRCLGER